MTLARRLSLLFTALAVAIAAAIGGLAHAATEHSLDTQIRITLSDAAIGLLAGQIPDSLVLGADDRTVPAGGTDGDDDADDTADTQGTDGTNDAAGTDQADGATGERHGRPGREPRRPRGSLLLAQTLDGDGRASAVSGQPVRLPVDAADRSLAAGSAEHVERFRVVTVDGTRYQLLTHSRGHGRGAVQVARTLAERDEVLTRLAGSILVIALAVAGAAGLAGVFVARRLTRRLVRLTAAAEQVTETGRLDVEVPSRGRDEVGRLGTAFDTMLGRLARSREDQQRLVQDAGHELRTPLTSIRTNISLLRRMAELPAAERDAVLDDLAGESRELTALIDELVELATDRYAGEEDTDVDLAELAGRVAARAGRRTGRTVTVEIAPDANPTIRGRSTGLERAVSNLVDNALKFDPDGDGPVEIGLGRAVDGGVRVAVSDRGPGIGPEDLELIFDRFHRATAMRSLPGSGLGLSIVRDVATSHGGRVFAADRPGGGAVIGFTLPSDRLQPSSNPD